MSKANNFVIGFDVMGGDLPPENIIPSLIQGLSPFDGKVSYRFYLQKHLIPPHLPPHVECIAVDDVITMQDDPIRGVKKKPNSSMSIGIQDLAKNSIDAFISHGNTGALTILSKKHLPKLPKILKPALMASLPSSVIVDVGASVEANADQLFQFALIGAAYQKLSGISNPRIGLLNIGSEETKGRVEHRAFHKKMKHFLASSERSFTFVGNVESQDIFKGKVDVVVTDGFSGNLFLKTAEASFAFLKTPIPFRNFPAAILAGIDGLVIKCHGNSGSDHFLLAAREAFFLLEKEFLYKIKEAL